MLPLSLNDKINISLLAHGIITEDEESENETETSKASTRFINTSDVERRAMLEAMKNTGHTVSSLATATGVEPSMISRLLRKPKRGDPDESARNPSINLAAQVSRELSTSPESLFPDIFNASRTEQRPKASKNRDRKSRKHLQRKDATEYQDGT